MSGFILSTVKSQLPMLIEKFEPVLEEGLRSSLKTMKARNPQQASVFLKNWTKLDGAIRSELSAPVTPVAPPPVGARRRVKRTRRSKRIVH